MGGWMGGWDLGNIYNGAEGARGWWSFRIPTTAILKSAPEPKVRASKIKSLPTMVKDATASGISLCQYISKHNAVISASFVAPPQLLRGKAALGAVHIHTDIS